MAVVEATPIHVQTLARDRGYYLEAETFVAEPLESVFEFFEKLDHREQLCPANLGLSIDNVSRDEHSSLIPEQSEVELGAGVLLDFQIRLFKIPVRVRNEIVDWRPGEKFTEVQQRGPFKLWRHEVSCTPFEGGTRIIDRLHFDVPGGDFVYKLMFRRHIESWFAYRHRELAERFG